MSGSDWVAASATSLANDIRTGRRSSVEVVTAVLERIDAVNPRINAVVRRVDGVLDAARRADEQLARGQAAGPLHGLPFTIKDSFDTAGTVTTAGTIGWRGGTGRIRWYPEPNGGLGSPSPLFGQSDMARSARAVIVRDGFTPVLAGITLPSMTWSPGCPKTR